MTGAEAIARGKRLIGAIEAQMLATDGGELFELLSLRGEREAALRLLAQTEARVRALRRAGTVQGTALHARWWPQVDVGASFGGVS